MRSVRCAKKEYLTGFSMATPTCPEVRRSLLARRRLSGFQPWNRWISCEKLYRNELPFKVEHQRLVKDIMIVEAGRDWILRAKTGWQARVEPQIGWWVGWVETPTGGHLRAEHRSAGRHEGCAETGGDCPIDTPVDRSTSGAETCTGFSGASHLCKPFPLRFVTDEIIAELTPLNPEVQHA